MLGSEEVEQDRESEEEHVEKEWNKVKLSLQNVAKKLLPKKVKKKRERMNHEILSKMEQRKNVKNKATEYNVINKEIVDECRQAKENGLNEQFEEIESLERQHKTKDMYDKVKELTKKCTLKGGGSITDKNGKILFDQEETDKRWVEYIKELCDDD